MNFEEYEKMFKKIQKEESKEFLKAIDRGDLDFSRMIKLIKNLNEKKYIRIPHAEIKKYGLTKCDDGKYYKFYHVGEYK
jgi:hypothetical protein